VALLVAAAVVYCCLVSPHHPEPKLSHHGVLWTVLAGEHSPASAAAGAGTAVSGQPSPHF